ncbi:MAG: tRNA pseudouridine(55) synthase TruB [Acidobacteria bacterium]|nr:tRNA pseudouridine(55) synthase TruB [Acidobacteriota bacterium]
MQQDGILLIDKPAGWTSHDVVARARKLLGTRRVGHTGTLDPFATGLLVLGVNRATRLMQFLAGDDKEYEAVARFGFATDTGDLTGAPLTAPVSATHLTVAQLDEAAASLRGRIQQIPPMYSAKKIGGVKLYELARRGEQIERQPVEIEIKTLEIVAAQPAQPAQPVQPAHDANLRDFTIRIVCSSGTYIRVLAEDLGKRLGLGAHLSSLRRTRAGQFSLGQAVTLERLAELAQTSQAGQALLPLRAALAFPEIMVEAAEQRALAYGQAVRRQTGLLEETLADGTLAKLCNPQGELLALAAYNASTQVWQPRLVLCAQPDRAT